MDQYDLGTDQHRARLLAAGCVDVRLLAQDLKKDPPPLTRTVKLTFDRPIGGLPILSTYDQTADYLVRTLRPELDDPREHAWVLALSSKLRLLTPPYLLSIGDEQSTHIQAATVYRFALVSGADRIVVVHSHPSGDVCPSDNDVLVTGDLVHAGKVLDIELADHFILAGCHRTTEIPEWYSFRKAGRL